MKCIVKNCAAITEYKFPDSKVHKDCCQCTYGYCKDIDCVIKQVIEKCKVVYNTERLNRYKTNGFILANDILQLFDIEE